VLQLALDEQHHRPFLSKMIKLGEPSEGAAEKRRLFFWMLKTRVPSSVLAAPRYSQLTFSSRWEYPCLETLRARCPSQGRALFFSMSKAIAEALRAQALKLVRLARLLPDQQQSAELEAVAIELLKQTGELEKESRAS
jgi:hypothetical protein